MSVLENPIRLPVDTEKLLHLLNTRHQAATLIQTWFRTQNREKASKLLALIKSLKRLRKVAAEAIQKFYKGYSVRKDLSFLKGIDQKKLIRWSHTAQSIYLTGSFTEPQWKHLLPMRYSKLLKEHISTALHDLKVARGSYYIKFLVDGQWMCDGNLAVTQDQNGHYNNIISVNDTHNRISRAMSVRSFQSAVNELAVHIKTQTLSSPIIFVRSISGNLESPRGFGLIEEQNLKQTVRLVMAGHMVGKPANKHSTLKEAGSADAWFIDQKHQVFGVADGVSEWSTFGLDPSRFPKEIMKHCVDVLYERNEDEENLTDKLENIVLEALERTTSYGSSTILLAACKNSILYTYCLGDSSFIVLRRREEGNSLMTVYRSVEQQHSFNCPFQLSNLPKPHSFDNLISKGFNSLVSLLKRSAKTMNDSPFDAESEMIPLKAGDIIVAGSDGLFDNLYDQDIIKTAEFVLGLYEEPECFAKHLATALVEKAIERGWDHNYRSPFARNAGKVGKKYLGGKLDDTTVIVGIGT